jgi:hypothetical protein
MISSWETTARYMYKHSKFVLSIPYSHSFVPAITSVRYVPEFHHIEIEGTLHKNISDTSIDAKMSRFNPQIYYNNEQSIYRVYREWCLEKNAEPKLS